MEEEAVRGMAVGERELECVAERVEREERVGLRERGVSDVTSSQAGE